MKQKIVIFFTYYQIIIVHENTLKQSNSILITISNLAPILNGLTGHSSLNHNFGVHEQRILMLILSQFSNGYKTFKNYIFDKRILIFIYKEISYELFFIGVPTTLIRFPTKAVS